MQMDYTAVFKGLNEAGLAYLVTGNIALNLHGVPRMSYDLDLVCGTDGENMKGVVRLLEKWGYRGGDGSADLQDDDGRRRLAARGLHAVSFVCAMHAVSQIDIAAAVTAPFAVLAARAVEVHLFGERVPIIAFSDLEAIKKERGSADDRTDLAGMEFLKARREGRDLPGFPAARREQMEKFQQWPAENRIDWLLTSSQLQRQMDEGGKGGSGRGGLKRRRIKGLRHTDLS